MTSRRNRALLVNPAHAGSYRSAIMRGDSLALAAVGQALAHWDFEVTVADCFLRGDEARQSLEQEATDADLVCVTLMHESAWEGAKQLVRRLRSGRPDLTVILGGAAPTLNPARFQEPGSGFDLVYAGTSLRYLRDAVESPAGRPSGTPSVVTAGTATDDDLQPLLARPDLEASFQQDRIICLESSQGCYARCSFCSIYSHHEKKWLVKTPQVVVAEVDEIRRRLPDCTELRFVDANFFGVPVGESDRRALAIGEALAARGLRFRAECRANDVRPGTLGTLVDLGLTGLFLGFESGVARVLRSLRKGATVECNLRAADILQSAGCSFSFGFMMITEEGGDEDIHSNVRFLSRLGVGVRWKHLFGGLIYQEGTELNRRALPVLGADNRLDYRLGYRPRGDLASKLLRVWNEFSRSHRGFLLHEHLVGVFLERGKESRDPRMWALDRQYSGLCLSRYGELLRELDSTSASELDAENVAGRCVAELQHELAGMAAALRIIGLPERVMLDDLRALLGAARASDGAIRPDAFQCLQ
jgi:radical SAM superfamily enzyme YgiQ (UPF0313 family)